MRVRLTAQQTSTANDRLIQSDCVRRTVSLDIKLIILMRLHILTDGGISRSQLTDRRRIDIISVVAHAYAN